MIRSCTAILRRCSPAVCMCFFSLVFSQPAPAVRDDEGRAVLRSKPAMRVVTLAPSLTELVYAAGAGDKLVGVSAYSDFPEAARQLPSVADAAGISWESLLAVKPDLVLAWKGGTRPSDIARLERLAINVSVIEVKQLDDVARAVESIGDLTGQVQAAGSAAKEFRRQLRDIRKLNSGKSEIRTFVQISAKPLMTINRDHAISEMISLCGGANVFADATALVSEPSREALLARNPDTVIYGSSVAGAGEFDAAVYAGLAAVAERRVFGITADYMFRPGPRMLLATGEICAALDRSREILKSLKPR